MSQLHRFFYNGSIAEGQMVALDADTAKHIWQVLRMDPDDRIVLTDGNGLSAEGIIQATERHKCDVVIDKVAHHPRRGALLHLCVGFTKNNSRNEWLLEKATELGVASITPVIAYRSEKTHVREERWAKILQSAILQSQQYYLPHLNNVMPLYAAVEQFNSVPQKLIAHCILEEPRPPLAETLKKSADTVLLIGPEGDFSREEVNLCRGNGFTPVSLGAQRLRTETAAIVSAAYFMVLNG